jgi:serine/threonine protein kinase/Tol biopolymer transport system component
MITPERLRQVEDIFHDARERAPGERVGFLDQACAGDDALRREVELLIAADEQAGSLIELPAYQLAASLIAEDRSRSLIGKSIGHYRIISLLGRGGMGEVYRARDTRLGREVAIKVLPREYSADADRLRRFEQEARAAGMLNHPNILTIYEIGTHGGAPYLVSELLEGATLREQLRGAALPLRRAVDYALQMARGLAAAHDKGIVHRDLKPENLFITKDGRLKILDFGLAKLRQPLPSGAVDTGAPTQSPGTAPGVVMGTVGYMSPEQVRAEEVDHRSDIFAFGAILYEMLAGQQAFRGASAAETMNAILKEEPPELSQTNRNVAPPLERLMRRCLEKSAEERFQSARDLAFALEALSGAAAPSAVAQAVAPVRSRRRLWLLLANALLIAMVALAAFFVGKRVEKTPPEFHRLTFRRGKISAARFAPDGQTIFYSATWQGESSSQIYSTRPESPESRPLGQSDAHLLAISASGEMAIALHPSQLRRGARHIKGTLAQMPMNGSAPRPVLQDVIAADWAPDGRRLAIVRELDGRNRLEFPSGIVVYETTDAIPRLRISPKGESIAFAEDRFTADGYSLAVVDHAGKKKSLSNGWSVITGIAWSPGGDEVWFTAGKVLGNVALYAVTLSGLHRLVAQVPHGMYLSDISHDGRVLLASFSISKEIKCMPPDEVQERDMSWLDWGHVADISADGRMLLFTEHGEGGGAGRTAYLRKTDGSPPIPLGEGEAQALSPDGAWVLVIRHTRSPSPLSSQVMLLPIGAGESRALTDDQINWQRAIWFPDGKRILLSGNEQGQGLRSYILELEGGKPRPTTPEGIVGRLVSPDGRWLITSDPEQKLSLFPVAGGEPRPIPGQDGRDEPIQWSTDGGSIYVRQDGGDLNIMRVYRLDLATGRRGLWKEYIPADPVRAAQFLPLALTPDGKSYAYTYARNFYDLYLVKGLK